MRRRKKRHPLSRPQEGKQVPDLPDALLSHKVSGRIRLKIPSKKGDSQYFESLKEQLYGFSGIKIVEINPMLGSVLIIHTSDVERIAEHAQKNSLFSLRSFKPNLTNLHYRVSEAFKDINKKIKGITGGDIDIAGLVFLSLLGLGIYQIMRGNFAAPAWYTAFWYAFDIFLKSGNKGGE